MQIDIATLRKKFDISQAELGILLGIDQSSVSRLEARGKARGALAKMLRRLSQYEKLPAEMKRELVG